MSILPDRTVPAATAVDRRHSPPPGPYTTYRPCLRWEFGFSCAFCLTHESDLAEHGVEATGLTSVEHQVPRSQDPTGGGANHYPNCFYACRFCNQSRGVERNVDALGRRLLDPCHDAWGACFTVLDDRLVPCAGDGDAERTHRVYDLDDPRKRQMRRTRAEVLRDAFRLLDEGPDRLARLLRLATEAPAQYRAELTLAARELRELMVRATRDVARFSAVPWDADAKCRCGTPGFCTLPSFIEAQLRASPG